MRSFKVGLKLLGVALGLMCVATACNAPTVGPPTAAPVPAQATTESVAPTDAPTSMPPAATAIPPSPTIEATPTTAATQAGAPEEVILILQPGPGSRVTSPLRVAGIADPTFEQALVVRLVLDDGSLFALEPAQIQSELGTRGPFEVELPFTVGEQRAALLQVYSSSARDGGLTHLSSVGLRLAPGGAPDIRPAQPGPEHLQIRQPALRDRISGGIAHVQGFGLASFEGTLLVQVYDAEGNQVGSQPIIVQAPDMGVPGPFVADVAYVVTAEGPGRIVVVDPLPVFDGLGHLASVEVELAP